MSGDDPYRSIVDHLADALVTHDLSGVVLDANANAFELCGYPPAALIGLNIAALMPSAHAQLIIDGFERLRSHGSLRFDQQLVRGDGSERRVEVLSQLVSTEGDGLVHAFLRDMTDRHQYEHALRQSERNFRSLAERLPLAICLSVGAEQVCEYINPKFVEMFGYTLEEVPFIDEWWPKAYPDPEYRERVATVWDMKVQRALATQTPIEPMESVVTCKDGTTKEVLWGYVPLGEKSYVHGLDLTERNRSQRRHRLVAEVLGLLNGQPSLGEALDAIAEAIKRGIGADRVVVRGLHDNARSASFGSYVPEPLAWEICSCGLRLREGSTGAPPNITPGGSTWTSNWAPDPTHTLRLGGDANTCETPGFRSVALIPIRAGSEVVSVLELASRTPDAFDADHVVFLEGLCVSVGLAIARRHAQEDLHRQTKLLRTATTLARIGGWEVDLDTRRLSWSEEVFRILELDSDFQPTLANARRFFAAEDQPRIRAALSAALRHSKPFDLHLHVTTTSGQVRNVHVRGELTLRDGKVQTLFGTFQDVTQKLLTETTLAQVQKLESLGTLAGGIAHDFNNILTAILGNLSLLQMDAHVSADSAEILEETQAACRTAAGLASQLLTFASGGAPITQVVDVQPIIAQAAAFTARGTSSRCVLNLGAAPLPARADPSQVAQVIQNLVLNAIQANPHGGNITVDAALLDLADGAHPHLTEGPYVRVRVCDNGPGIPPDILPRVFDPYFSRKRQGRGLGLAVCHSILAKHGGHIEVSSTLGQGACFTLHLPAANEVELPKATVTHSVSVVGARVLIMDDDATVANALNRMLERLGYAVETTSDGASAVAAYQASLTAGRRYDAVILDLTVAGGMGGKDAITELRGIDPGVVGIVSSGYSADPVMANHASYGFSAMLPKPYTVDAVRELLSALLAR